MITRIEADRERKPVRVFHRAGTLVVDGDKRKDAKYAWTHPMKEQKTCVACKSGRIPPGIMKEEK